MAVNSSIVKPICLTQTPLKKDEFEMCVCRETLSPIPQQIVKLIKQNPSSLEAGLTIVDFDLIIPNVGEIDLLAVSNGGQIVIVRVLKEISAAHIGGILAINEWLSENENILKRVCLGKNGGDFSYRIVLLCSKMDNESLLLLRMINSFELEAVRYRRVKSDSMQWLLLEKIANNTEKPSNKIRKLPSKAELTEEEISEFFSPDGELEGSYFNS